MLEILNQRTICITIDELEIMFQNSNMEICGIHISCKTMLQTSGY